METLVGWRVNPENSKGAQDSSAPAPPCRVMAQGCSRLAARVEQTEVSLVCVSNTRIWETQQTEWGHVCREEDSPVGKVVCLGWGLGTALWKPMVGVQCKAGIEEEAGLPPVPLESACRPPLQHQCLCLLRGGVLAGACGHWLRSMPRLPIKARVFTWSILMMCVNVYFVASAQCLLGERGGSDVIRAGGWGKLG